MNRHAIAERFWSVVVDVLERLQYEAGRRGYRAWVRQQPKRPPMTEQERARAKLELKNALDDLAQSMAKAATRPHPMLAMSPKGGGGEVN